MKKLIITTSLIIGIGLTAVAENNTSGLFGRASNGNGRHSGYVLFGAKDGESATTLANTPMLPAHGQENNQPAPLGSGIAILLGLGGTYLISKRYKKQ